MIRILVATLLLSTLTAHAFTVDQNQFMGTDISYSCPDDLNRYMTDAFQAWNVALDGLLKFKRVDENGQISVFETDQDLGQDVGGLTYMLGAHAVIVLKVNSEYRVVVHELGHAFGMLHGGDGVMRPTPTTSYLTQDDVDGIRTIYGLSLKSFGFTVKTARRRVKVTAFFEKQFLEYEWGDGTVNLQHAIARHRYPRGTYTITMYYKTAIMSQQIVSVK